MSDEVQAKFRNDHDAAIGEIIRLRAALRGDFQKTTPSASGQWFTFSAEAFHEMEENREDLEERVDAAEATIQAAYDALHLESRERAVEILHDAIHLSPEEVITKLRARAAAENQPHVSLA